ncbi:MAG: hypothetical protein Q4F75_06725, partial [Pseudomonadota bacterium]|nr:hypothetical protein [Pseudomonadota bacterium]
CDPDTKVGDGKTCTTADGTTYYDRCLVKETCFSYDTGKFQNEKGTCNKSYKNVADPGFYRVGTRCITQSGTIYAYVWKCGSTEPDCYGNMPSCAGKKECKNDLGYGEPCICGKKKYFDDCDPCQKLFDEGRVYENGGRCFQAVLAPGQEFNSKGYFFVKERCIFQDGSKLIGYEACDATWSGGKDCNGNPVPCHGMMLCENDEGADGEIACECGGKKYFNKCKEMCMHTASGTSSAYHYQYLEDSKIFLKDGNYPVKEVCTRLDGRKVYTSYGCNKTTPDQLGNMPPCAGMKECLSGTWGSGDGCSCGGRMFFNECISGCSYEDTAETCAAKGQSFEQKCYGSKNGQQVWFGECK